MLPRRFISAAEYFSREDFSKDKSAGLKRRSTLVCPRSGANGLAVNYQ
jgi:hypothetical protein